MQFYLGTWLHRRGVYPSHMEDLHDRKSDPHDVTDWSTDYMLCKAYCVTVLCTVLIKYKYLWRIVLNVCTSLTLQQFIY